MATPAHERLAEQFSRLDGGTVRTTDDRNVVGYAGGAGQGGGIHEPGSLRMDGGSASEVQGRLFEGAAYVGGGMPSMAFRALLERELAAACQNDPNYLMRQLAIRLVEYGRAVGRAEAARLARTRERERISRILDQATAAFPDIAASDASRLDWQEARQLLWKALSNWHDGLDVEPLTQPPNPADAQALLDAALRIVKPAPTPIEGRIARARRSVAAYANTAADFANAVAEVLERRRAELKSSR